MAVINHTGHVVTDLARSKRFYQEVFGFVPWYEINPPDEAMAKLCVLDPPLGTTASYLILESWVLELIHYSAPEATAPLVSRAMNQPGLTHLSFSVDDVRATAQRAVAFGGSIVEESDVGAAIFVRDPDGQLLELLPITYQDNLPAKP